MPRLFSALFLAHSLFLPFALSDGPTENELKKKPITTARGELGDLLKTWWLKGTAAGNVGDFYDNRDGDHSPLDLSPYPQPQRIVYTPEDLKLRRNWAWAKTTRPHVTFSNSSTSAHATQGGSKITQAELIAAGQLASPSAAPAPTPGPAAA